MNEHVMGVWDALTGEPTKDNPDYQAAYNWAKERVAGVKVRVPGIVFILPNGKEVPLKGKWTFIPRKDDELRVNENFFTVEGLGWKVDGNDLTCRIFLKDAPLNPMEIALRDLARRVDKVIKQVGAV
jgi:hypothetical protein